MRQRSYQGMTVVELLITLSIIAILGTLLLRGGCMGCNDSYSVGKRQGQVVKFSQKGVIWKSWEGALQLGGQTTVAAGVWDFSATDEAVIKKLQMAYEAGRPVSLLYHQWWVSPVWIDSGYVVVDVEPAATAER